MAARDCPCCDGDGVVFLGTGVATHGIACPVCVGVYHDDFSEDDRREVIAMAAECGRVPKWLWALSNG